MTNQSTTPQLDIVLKRAEALYPNDRYAALVAIAEITEKHGLYRACKHWDVLVDDSAEDFAIQFYTAFNKEVYYRY